MEVGVIYGGLPPGTKLAQAQKFNDPESSCKVLVATDAIGMGLNLWVNVSLPARTVLLKIINYWIAFSVDNVQLTHICPRLQRLIIVTYVIWPQNSTCLVNNVVLMRGKQSKLYQYFIIFFKLQHSAICSLCNTIHKTLTFIYSSALFPVLSL